MSAAEIYSQGKEFLDAQDYPNAIKYFDMLVYLVLGSQLSVLDTGIIEFPIALQIEVMYGVVVGLVTFRSA